MRASFGQGLTARLTLSTTHKTPWVSDTLCAPCCSTSSCGDVNFKRPYICLSSSQLLRGIYRSEPHQRPAKGPPPGCKPGSVITTMCRVQSDRASARRRTVSVPATAFERLHHSSLVRAIPATSAPSHIYETWCHVAHTCLIIKEMGPERSRNNVSDPF